MHELEHVFQRPLCRAKNKGPAYLGYHPLHDRFLDTYKPPARRPKLPLPAAFTHLR